MLRRLFAVVTAVQVFRHGLLLRRFWAITQRFLRAQTRNSPFVPESDTRSSPSAIVIPVLREQTHVAEAIQHFTPMLDALDDVLLIVTTEREAHEAGPRPGPSTAEVVD